MAVPMNFGPLLFAFAELAVVTFFCCILYYCTVSVWKSMKNSSLVKGVFITIDLMIFSVLLYHLPTTQYCSLAIFVSPFPYYICMDCTILITVFATCSDLGLLSFMERQLPCIFQTCCIILIAVLVIIECINIILLLFDVFLYCHHYNYSNITTSLQLTKSPEVWYQTGYYWFLIVVTTVVLLIPVICFIMELFQVERAVITLGDKCIGLLVLLFIIGTWCYLHTPSYISTVLLL